MTTADISKYHHPHFISAEPNGLGGTRYTFRPFTGNEPAPERPPASDLSREDSVRLYHQYSAAYTMWSKGRFRRQAAPALTAAMPAWQACARARKAMDAEFAALRETTDGQWRAQVLRLTEAQDQALADAEAWDRVATRLASLQHEHCWHDLTLRDVAGGAGIDITGWHIGWYEDGSYQDRLADNVRDAISAQKDRLREVGELAALPGSEM